MGIIVKDLAIERTHNHTRGADEGKLTAVGFLVLRKTLGSEIFYGFDKNNVGAN